MTTRETAEQVALQGLLLLVVEIQNRVQEAAAAGMEIDPCVVGMGEIEELVESDHARELVQLARAALDAPATPAAIPAAIAGVHT